MQMYQSDLMSLCVLVDMSTIAEEKIVSVLITALGKTKTEKKREKEKMCAHSMNNWFQNSVSLVPYF